MASTYNFTTASGQTIAREMLIAYINTAASTASSPTWSPLGAWVEDSSLEYDWGEETTQDILGVTHATMKKPVVTQTFDPSMLTNGDAAIKAIWDDAIVAQNVQALSAKDILIAHIYAGFGERYSACMVKPVSLGGEGGGNVSMGYEVTYGGTRTIGAVSVTAGVPTFTPETSGGSGGSGGDEEDP